MFASLNNSNNQFTNQKPHKMSTSVELTEKVVKAAKEVKQTYKQQVEQNKRYKAALSEECRKLGYGLNLIEKFAVCFDKPVIDYVKRMKKVPVLYSLCEANCKRTKAGNFSVWLLQGYIREQINKG
jgi:hypothetical protein